MICDCDSGPEDQHRIWCSVMNEEPPEIPSLAENLEFIHQVNRARWCAPSHTLYEMTQYRRFPRWSQAVGLLLDLGYLVCQYPAAGLRLVDLRGGAMAPAGLSSLPDFLWSPKPAALRSLTLDAAVRRDGLRYRWCPQPGTRWTFDKVPPFSDQVHAQVEQLTMAELHQAIREQVDRAWSESRQPLLPCPDCGYPACLCPWYPLR